MEKVICSFTIATAPRTKKNSGQIVFRGNRPILLPSKQFREYQLKCATQMPDTITIADPVNVKAIFYMDSRRRVDLVNLQEALLDVLVHYGVLEDDNCKIVVSMDGSRVDYDKDNPRTEVVIERL